MTPKLRSESFYEKKLFIITFKFNISTTITRNRGAKFFPDFYLLNFKSNNIFFIYLIINIKLI